MMLDTPFDRHEDYAVVHDDDAPAPELPQQHAVRAHAQRLDRQLRLRRPLLALGLALLQKS
jgi:hypothetical protein